MVVLSKTFHVMTCVDDNDVCAKDAPGPSPTAPGPASLPQGQGSSHVRLLITWLVSVLLQFSALH